MRMESRAKPTAIEPMPGRRHRISAAQKIVGAGHGKQPTLVWSREARGNVKSLICTIFWSINQQQTVLVASSVLEDEIGGSAITNLIGSHRFGAQEWHQQKEKKEEGKKRRKNC
jgi:hypothetical protein